MGWIIQQGEDFFGAEEAKRGKPSRGFPMKPRKSGAGVGQKWISRKRGFSF